MNKGEVVIRAATRRDAVGISGVMVKCLNVKTIKEGKAAVLHEMAQRHRFVVAKNPEGIIGFMSWLMQGRPRHGLAELYHLAVLERYRGEGLGTKLIERVLEDIKKCYKKEGFSLRKLYFLTRLSNVKAQKLYKRLGFKRETVLKEHFYPKDDELVMSRFFDKNN